MRLKSIFIGLLTFGMIFASVVHAADFVLVVGPETASSKPLTEAEKLFVRLLDRGDRLGVVRFADEALVANELSDVSTSRFSILRAISRPAPQGSYSNIYDALVKAKELLQKESSEKKTVVLVTDRGMDLGIDDKNEEYSLKLLVELLPECKRKGIRIYTVALSQDADSALLSEIAHETLGIFYKANQPEKLYQVFSDIFANTKLADEIPVKDGQFLVDREIREIKIVLSRKNTKPIITLLQPDGRKVTYKRHPSHYKWYSSKDYELAIISRPLPGQWKIIYGSDSDTRVFVRSSLEMKITDIPGVVKTGKKQKFYMWLQKDNRILKNTSLVLRAVEFDIWVTPPDGKPVRVSINDQGTDDDDLAKDGVYTGSFVSEKKGDYIVCFLSAGKNFYREKTIRFYAKQTVRKQEKTSSAKKHIKKSRKKSVSSNTEVVSEKEYSLKKALIKFAIFNAILITMAGICFGAVLFIKKKGKKAEEEEEESED